jgi:hypothetical protein
MWPTISFTDNPDSRGNTQADPRPDEGNPGGAVPSIKETANAISDNLMMHVDRALESASTSVKTALPPSH